MPLQTEYYALEGLSQLLNTVRLVQRNLNSSLEIEGVLLTMVDERTNLTQQVIAEVREHFQDQVFETQVPRSIRLAEAPSFGKTIFEYDAENNLRQVTDAESGVSTRDYDRVYNLTKTVDQNGNATTTSPKKLSRPDTRNIGNCSALRALPANQPASIMLSGRDSTRSGGRSK